MTSNDIDSKLKSKQMVLSYDESLMKAGCFGRFQLLASFLFCCNFVSGNWVIYGLAFLEAYPDYQRYQDGVWVDTTREQICKQQLSHDQWRINYQSKNSFHNWVDPKKLDLTCTPDYVIGMIGSCYFLGFLMAASFGPRMADRVGRKPVLAICLTLQILVYFGLFISHNVNLTIVLIFLFGCCAPAREVLSATYMNEFVHEEYQVSTTTMMNVFDASLMIVQALMYLVVPSWFSVHTIGIIGSIFILWGNLMLPESPKYYFAHRQYDQARIQLQKVARLNGLPQNEVDSISDVVFDTELEYLKLIEGQQKATFEQVTAEDSPCDDNYLNVEAKDGIVLTGVFRQMCEVSYLRNNFIGLIVIHTTTNFGYQMINFQVGRIPGGIMKNTFCSQFGELAAVLGSGIMLSLFGIKKSFLINFVISLIGTLLMLYFWHNIDYLVVFIFLAKFGVSGTYNILYVGYVKLLPTVYNNTAFGYSQIVANSVSMMSPVVANLKYPMPMMCGMISLSFALLCTLLINEKSPRFI